MSVRHAPTSGNKQPHVEQLQKELSDLKNAALAANLADTAAPAGAEAAPNAPSFDSLTHTEQAAASLGVHPESWKPIGWINNSHFTSLMKENALDETLARRIEVRFCRELHSPTPLSNLVLTLTRAHSLCNRPTAPSPARASRYRRVRKCCQRRDGDESGSCVLLRGVNVGGNVGVNVG